MTSPATDADRRIKNRFRAPCLEIGMRRRSLLGWREEAVTLSCIDINRYGIGLQSPVPLGEGMRVQLDFRGKYISQSAVHATVVSVRPYRTGYRLGLHFDYCMDRRLYNRALDNALSRIEALYNKLQSERSRRCR